MSLRRPARGRRGATVVLVALLMVPLVGIAALSLDVSWWQLGANQLQTSADAAALAGARALQLYPTDSTQAKAESYAGQVAASNKAFAQPVTVSGADVEPMFWTPSTRTLTASSWASANAVRVTTRATPGLVFAGVARAVAPTVTRQGVAWVANLHSLACPKPFGLPYAALQSMVGSANDPLTAADLAVLDNLTELQRTVVVLPPGLANSYVPPTPNVGTWAPMVFGGGASVNVYRNLVQGTNCSTEVATLGVATQPVATQPSSGNNIPNETTNHFVNIGGQGCYGPTGSGNGNTTGGNGNPSGSTPPGNGNGGGNGSGGNGGNGGNGGGNGNGAGNGGGTGTGGGATTSSALCYRTAAEVGEGTPGVTVMVTWVAPSGGNGSNANTVKMLAEFKVMCYFSSTTDRCANTGSWTPNLVANAYPEGTIVGVVSRRTFLALGRGEELGNTPSTSQRLILVR